MSIQENSIFHTKDMSTSNGKRKKFLVRDVLSNNKKTTSNGKESISDAEKSFVSQKSTSNVVDLASDDESDDSLVHLMVEEDLPEEEASELSERSTHVRKSLSLAVSWETPDRPILHHSANLPTLPTSRKKCTKRPLPDGLQYEGTNKKKIAILSKKGMFQGPKRIDTRPSPNTVNTLYVPMFIKINTNVQHDLNNVPASNNTNGVYVSASNKTNADEVTASTETCCKNGSTVNIPNAISTSHSANEQCPSNIEENSNISNITKQNSSRIEHVQSRCPDELSIEESLSLINPQGGPSSMEDEDDILSFCDSPPSSDELTDDESSSVRQGPTLTSSARKPSQMINDSSCPSVVPSNSSCSGCKYLEEQIKELSAMVKEMYSMIKSLNLPSLLMAQRAKPNHPDPSLGVRVFNLPCRTHRELMALEEKLKDKHSRDSFIIKLKSLTPGGLTKERVAQHWIRCIMTEDLSAAFSLRGRNKKFRFDNKITFKLIIEACKEHLLWNSEICIRLLISKWFQECRRRQEKSIDNPDTDIEATEHDERSKDNNPKADTNGDESRENESVVESKEISDAACTNTDVNDENSDANTDHSNVLNSNAVNNVDSSTVVNHIVVNDTVVNNTIVNNENLDSCSRDSDTRNKDLDVNCKITDVKIPQTSIQQLDANVRKRGANIELDVRSNIQTSSEQSSCKECDVSENTPAYRRYSKSHNEFFVWIDDNLPCKSLEIFTILEEKLKSRENAKIFNKYLMLLNRCRRGSSLCRIIQGCIKRVMTDELCMCVSLTGRSGKRQFDNTRTYISIIDNVRQLTPDAVEEDSRRAISDWFSQSKFRVKRKENSANIEAAQSMDIDKDCGKNETDTKNIHQDRRQQDSDSQNEDNDERNVDHDSSVDVSSHSLIHKYKIIDIMDAQEKTEALFNLPCKSHEDFMSVEAKLRDENNRELFGRYMECIALTFGKKQKQLRGKINRVLKQILTDELGATISLTGKSPGKVRFDNTRIYNLIIDVMMNVVPNQEVEGIRHIISDWLSQRNFVIYKRTLKKMLPIGGPGSTSMDNEIESKNSNDDSNNMDVFLAFVDGKGASSLHDIAEDNTDDGSILPD